MLYRLCEEAWTSPNEGIPPILALFVKSFTPRRDGWIRSTCFLQSSCVFTSLPLDPPAVGVWWGPGTLEASHASNSLITHTLPPHNFPIISSPSSSLYQPTSPPPFACEINIGRERSCCCVTVNSPPVRDCCGYFPNIWTNQQLHAGQTKERG